ncbi:MAG: VOC family protein [Myxococcota bacterium]
MTAIRFGYAILFVPSVQDALTFYERAFGFQDSFLHPAGDYGELKTGDTKIAFTSHTLATQAVPFTYQPIESAQPTFGVEFTLVTPDVDAAFTRATQAGAEPLAQPHDTSWGQRVAYVRDCHGLGIGIATPMD